MRRTRGGILLAAALLCVILAACGEPSNVSKSKAIMIANRETPMDMLSDALETPSDPVMWSILGADRSGRTMAVWVRRTVEKYIYLDKGISREEAASIAQRVAGQMEHAEVDPRAVLVNPQKPTWWVAVKIGEQPWGYIVVDFATGEARANPHDPWDEARPGSP